jgi:hypothetical protein
MTHALKKSGPGKYRSSVTRLTATCSTIELPGHGPHGSTVERGTCLSLFTQLILRKLLNYIHAFPCRHYRSCCSMYHIRQIHLGHMYHILRRSTLRSEQNLPRESPYHHSTHRNSYTCVHTPIAYNCRIDTHQPYPSHSEYYRIHQPYSLRRNAC